MRRQLIYTFGFLVFAALEISGQMGAFVEPSSRKVKIGDHLTLHYTIDRDPEAVIEEIDFSALSDSLWINIIDTSEINQTEKAGSVQMDFSIVLSLYEEGAVQLPGLPVYYLFNGQRDTFYTDPVSVNVDFLPDPETIAPLKDIIAEPGKWHDNLLYYLTVAGVLLIIAGILWAGKKRASAGERVPPAPALPERHAHEIALEQLQILEEKNWPAKGMIKEFQVELTGIMRNYIRSRFNINAPELTSNETLIELSRRITARQLGAVREILNIADLVKFAKYQPAENIHATLLEKAKDFFIKTAKNRPHL